MEREQLLNELSGVASELNKFEQAKSTTNKEYGRERKKHYAEVLYNYSPEYDRRTAKLVMPRDMYISFLDERIAQLREELSTLYNKLYPTNGNE